MPRSSATSSSDVGTATAFGSPSTSTNHSRTKRTPRRRAVRSAYSAPGARSDPTSWAAIRWPKLTGRAAARYRHPDKPTSTPVGGKPSRSTAVTRAQPEGRAGETGAPDHPRHVPRASDLPRGVAIVGGGIAGRSLAEELRARNAHVRITLVCGEPAVPYDRVRLSELPLGDDDAEALRLRPAEWYADERVELLTGAWVSGVDPRTATLSFADGSRRAFSAVALATGSDPLLPPLPGLELDGVMPFRGPEDCDALRAAESGGARVAVIGGGLLGLEAARGALARGAQVTVVHLVDRLMERQLDAPAGARLLASFAALGVDVRLEHATQAVVGGPEGRVAGLRFADGSELACDAVVVSIGIRPSVALARASGLEVRRGIVADDRLRSSVPEVVAVGSAPSTAGRGTGSSPRSPSSAAWRRTPCSAATASPTRVVAVGQARGGGDRPRVDRGGRRRRRGRRLAWRLPQARRARRPRRRGDAARRRARRG